MGLRLALTGGFLSGKSTVAKELARRGFTYINYTDHLKELAVKALAALGIEVTVEQIHADKEKYRPFLIELGTLLGFDQGNFVEDVVDAHGNPEFAVFDNVRFDAQMDKLLKYNYRLVRVEVPRGVRLRRAEGAGISAHDFYERTRAVTEQGLSYYPDEISVSNSDEVRGVVDILLRLAGVDDSGGLNSDTRAA